MQVVADAPQAARFLEPIVSVSAGRLAGVARRLLPSDDLAADAVQEALVALWARAEPPHDPEAWLVRVVVKRCLHARRGLDRRRRHECRACAARGDASRREDPHDALERKERRALVRAALRALAEPYRTVLELKEFEGRDYESIARILDVPVGTVRSRLNRARAALRARIDAA